MNILLLGGTGRTGKLVLQVAKEQGHRVNCLVRNAGKTPNSQRAQVFEGNAINSDDLEKAISGCEAVVSVLNISRTSDFPWARLRTPSNYLSEVMTNTIRLSKKHSIRRLVVCSAWGVAETKKDLPAWFNWFIDNSKIGVAYKDHECQEKLLNDSDLDWTIVRPSGLTNSKKQQKIIESYANSPAPKLFISRLSVAQFMIEALKRDDLIKKAPVISAN